MSTPFRVAGDAIGAVGLVGGRGRRPGGRRRGAGRREPASRSPSCRASRAACVRRVALALSQGSTGLMEGLRAEDVERLPEPAAAYLDNAPGVGRFDTLLIGLGSIRLVVEDALGGPGAGAAADLGRERDGGERLAVGLARRAHARARPARARGRPASRNRLRCVREGRPRQHARRGGRGARRARARRGPRRWWSRSRSSCGSTARRSPSPCARPGHDIELAAGFLVTEGIVSRLRRGERDRALRRDDATWSRSAPSRARPGVRRPADRHFFASSSCGICGKATLEALRTLAKPVHGDPDARRREVCSSRCPRGCARRSRCFARPARCTRPALFSADGALLCAREDVGRHNAVDKVVGWAALERRLPLAGTILLASGRLGFEIAQKALVAGIPGAGRDLGPVEPGRRARARERA